MRKRLQPIHLNCAKCQPYYTVHFILTIFCRFAEQIQNSLIFVNVNELSKIAIKSTHNITPSQQKLHIQPSTPKLQFDNASTLSQLFTPSSSTRIHFIFLSSLLLFGGMFIEARYTSCSTNLSLGRMYCFFWFNIIAPFFLRFRNILS